MFDKPKKPKRQVNNGGFDHVWSKKRSLNIQSMIKKMQKDRAYMFKVAHELLNSYSDVPWKIGDEAGSMLIAWVSMQMDNEYRRELAKKPKKAKRSRR